MVKAALVPLAVVASAAQAFETKIINGIEAPIGKFLYTTGFHTEDISGAYCVGALIAPKYVLTGATSAHTVHQLYLSSQKTAFKYIDCWHVLKMQPKCLKLAKCEIKDRNATKQPADEADNKDFDLEGRPSGNKLAKRMLKKDELLQKSVAIQAEVAEVFIPI
ncbi:hypothetical protein H257_17708 [Aphanomyces astaci]|uniref:Peptidase S1 domain-containing protein n=1 Tax=Aphanomyces astaci TaxID=112090 RepID=W4FDU1_APHAT|nr:hypothetical protein H257_17708 [Aphanomyces astaci]ETV65657.1 hypothetical protein H257_17708 [Aphanomyces astaci]|eukprot:XP_009844896.1 hypothetical protein H257_17708 [Aphanomyces astaci]